MIPDYHLPIKHSSGSIPKGAQIVTVYICTKIASAMADRIHESSLSLKQAKSKHTHREVGKETQTLTKELLETSGFWEG